MMKRLLELVLLGLLFMAGDGMAHIDGHPESNAQMDWLHLLVDHGGILLPLAATILGFYAVRHALRR